MSAITLQTATDSLSFDRRTGRLRSFRGRSAPALELLASSPDHPVFVIQYLDRRKEYRRLTSFDAAEVRIEVDRRQGAATLNMTFRRLGGFDLDVAATVRASSSEPGTRWNITLRNGAGLRVVDVQYPFIVARYDHEANVLLPASAGRLIQNPTPQRLGPDCDGAWRICPENGNSTHYPGGLFAQFMAYFNSQAGIYMACEDTAANVKLLKPLHREPGIRLGLAHVGDWPSRGERMSIAQMR